jgi:NADPH:quinone reductase-like Zn-dependent oxidoreductase
VENIFEMPGHLTFEEAAALPLAGLTGYRALFTQGQMKVDCRLLITGIGGGVAALSMQMAAAAGGRIYVTSSDDTKIQKAIKLGEENGANYRQEDWPVSLRNLTGGKGFDLIIDSAGGSGFQQLIDLVTPGGKIVIFGVTAGTTGDINLRKIFWNQVSIQGTTMGTPDDFRQMVKFINTYKIKPVIHTVYDLSDYKKAYEDMINGKQFGKIVLRVAE